MIPKMQAHFGRFKFTLINCGMARALLAPAMGRDPCLDAATVRRVIRCADKLRKRPQGVTGAAIKKMLKLDCSVRTIQRTLREGGLHYRNRVRKSAVTKADIVARQAWARSMRRFKWTTVRAFSDAKFFKFPLADHGGRRSAKVWVRKGEKYDPWACIVPGNFKAPGVHVLGSIIKKQHTCDRGQ